MLLLNTSIVPPGGFRFVAEETGRHISAPNWRALRDQVIQHFKANNIPVGTDIDGQIQSWLCNHLNDPRAHCYERGKKAIAVSAGGGSTGYNGAHKWRELHNYALSERPNPLQRVAWLENFANSLPCGECKTSWKRLVRQKPLPQNATPEEFFAWGVERHNDVSSKLGKPTLTLTEARKLYA